MILKRIRNFFPREKEREGGRERERERERGREREREREREEGREGEACLYVRVGERFRGRVWNV